MTGAMIRKAREARGWSQARLAEASGIHQPDISDLENGKQVNVQTATLERIAAALGYRVKITMEPQEEAATSAA